MRQFSFFVDAVALVAIAQYFRAAALPLVKSWKLYPAMGVRPTLVNRIVLASAVISAILFSLDLIFVLVISHAPIWALVVRLVGLWITFLISIAAFKFAPVEPLPAVRAAVAVADAHELLVFAKPERGEQHALNAVAAWERVIELAPENAGVRDRMGHALIRLAGLRPAQAAALHQQAQREFALGAAFREAHDRLERPRSLARS
jgi:hypothetical protein